MQTGFFGRLTYCFLRRQDRTSHSLQGTSSELSKHKPLRKCKLTSYPGRTPYCFVGVLIHFLCGEGGGGLGIPLPLGVVLWTLESFSSPSPKHFPPPPPTQNKKRQKNVSAQEPRVEAKHTSGLQQRMPSHRASLSLRSGWHHRMWPL